MAFCEQISVTITVVLVGVPLFVRLSKGVYTVNLNVRKVRAVDY
jgi:hypothetical protein